MGKVSQVLLIGKGFSLETDIPIGVIMILVLKPTDKVFESIPDIKG